MRKLTMTIDSAVCAQFPEFVCGAFVVKGLPGAKAGQFLVDPETLKTRLASQGVTEETILAHPAIAGWRRAIQTLGLKAAKFRGSAEQLVRRAVRGEEIKAPGDLVRLYCQLSALHVAPLGGYDVRALPSTDIVVRFARRTDGFQPLGATNSDDMNLSERIVVYATGDNVICWAFNVRDDRRTALTETTTEAIFTTEAVFPEQRAASCAALNELRQCLENAGANVSPIVWTTGDVVEVG